MKPRSKSSAKKEVQVQWVKVMLTAWIDEGGKGINYFGSGCAATGTKRTTATGLSQRTQYSVYCVGCRHGAPKDLWFPGSGPLPTRRVRGRRRAVGWTLQAALPPDRLTVFGQALKQFARHSDTDLAAASAASTASTLTHSPPTSYAPQTAPATLQLSNAASQ